MVKKINHKLINDILIRNIEEHINHLDVAIRYYRNVDKTLFNQYFKESRFYTECLKCIKNGSIINEKNINIAIAKRDFYKENMQRNKTFIKRYKLLRAIISKNNARIKSLEKITF